VRYASAAAVASANVSLPSSPEKADSASWILVDVEAEDLMRELSLETGSSYSQLLSSSSAEGKPLTKKERKKWTEIVGGTKMGGHGRDWSREHSLLD
jgi:hypothetical protein